MTKDFIAIARNRRLIALNEIENRKRNGATVAKIHALPDLTKRHVDAVFRTKRKPLVLTEAAQLAA